MSFVKALEMADQLQLAEQKKERDVMRPSHRYSHTPGAGGDAAADANDSQHYGSSYEISV